ncbi:SRPBCC family protein [Phyllobacterium sp. OV277]|uniref:SRPBCC family protein n=1 Tax=Phyllobacterium sp. OV277 TaxID=1882772 RepID=UPI000B823B7A|nr:SRPBCC family protein [Phyllobacterium sp. OV277]
MAERSVKHATIVVERTYEATPERVFAAWSSVEALLRWNAMDEGWYMAYDQFDFRVGGGEICRFGRTGGETYINTSTYQDIVPNRRIISSGTMKRETTSISSGVVTVELTPDDKGCHLVLTEQAAFLDDEDKPEYRQAGWSSMLDNLGKILKNETASA